MLCGPGVHVCCLRAAGVLWVCVEVLWTLGVGMQEHMTTPSIHPTNTHTHTHQLQKGASMHVKNVCWANCPSAPRHSKCIIDPVALILVSFELIVIVYLICEHMFSVT